MTLQQKLLELNAPDGPNIPMTTLAIYCGTSHTTLIQFSKKQRNISAALQQQIEKGLREYGELVYKIICE